MYMKTSYGIKELSALVLISKQETGNRLNQETKEKPCMFFSTFGITHTI